MLDIVPYVISWQSAAIIALAFMLSIGGGVIAMTGLSGRRRRTAAASLVAGGVLLALFSATLLLGMYAPGGASVYEARKLVLASTATASTASILAAFLVLRAAREPK